MSTAEEVQARLLPTPFFSSWVGRARPGDTMDPDPARRAAAWAHWAVSNVVEMLSTSGRTYTALLLDGRFHDPRGSGPMPRPHLEIPARVLSKPDPEFPDRLAQVGNGLAFKWWLVSEVTAVRRVLFNHTDVPVHPAVEMLNERRGVLADAVNSLARVAAPAWGAVEHALVSSEDGLVDTATGDFDTETVADFLAAASELGLYVTFDRRLAEANGTWASRRVGVWQVHGADGGTERFCFGVITPRLTASSQFSDRLFATERESPASLLVRGLVLRRLIDRLNLGRAEVAVADPAKQSSSSGPYLRAIPAKVGAKLPEASLDAAVYWLQTYPDPERAWSVLTEWADRNGGLLTVAKEGFCESHRNALRYLRRAEDPERDDVNVILPIAWEGNRVVRVTFVHPAS